MIMSVLHYTVVDAMLHTISFDRTNIRALRFRVEIETTKYEAIRFVPGLKVGQYIFSPLLLGLNVRWYSRHILRSESISSSPAHCQSVQVPISLLHRSISSSIHLL